MIPAAGLGIRQTFAVVDEVADVDAVLVAELARRRRVAHGEPAGPDVEAEVRWWGGAP